MTLIAGFTVEETPWLIGDIILSGDRIRENSVVLPTVGPIGDRFATGKHDIVGTRQKLQIISKDVAIAWSGCENTAVDVERRLTDLVENCGASASLIRGFLNDLNERYGDEDFHLIGFYIGNCGVPELFTHNASTSSNQRFGEFAAEGTGRDFIVNELRMAPQFPQRDAESGITKYTHSAVFIDHILARLIHAEIEDPSRLQLYAGGSYEKVTYLDGEFVKIADNALCGFDALMEPDSHEIRQKIYLAYDYVDDFLRVRTVDDTTDPSVAYEIFVPPLREPSQQPTEAYLQELSARPFTLRREWLALFVDIYLGDYPIPQPLRVTKRSDPRDELVLFDVRSGQFIVDVSDKFIVSIRREISRCVETMMETGQEVFHRSGTIATDQDSDDVLNGQ